MVGSAARHLRAKTVNTVLRSSAGSRTMPKLLHISPRYRLHRPSGQAVVTLGAKTHYLGPWKSKSSKVEFDRLTGEWLAAGRQPSSAAAGSDLTVVELVARYWKHAKQHYVKNGQPTGAIPGIRVALRILKRHYGHTAASRYGPLALKSLRLRMVEADQSRRYINDNIDRVRRVFKWAVGEELILPVVCDALYAVPRLSKGRTTAREVPPVRPVDDEG